MPKRTDIKKILIIGSGPIIIGQAAEFDYSGTQACKALKEEGYEVILVNSNPATIMTDPEIADKTYIEPLTPSVIEKILEIERPDVLLPTLGGQTGLNLTTILAENKILDKYGIEKKSRTGYSIGIGYPPDWGEHTLNIYKGDMTVLKPNVCFHMIAVMQFGDWGVEASEAIRVTENGSELFCDFPKELHIKS